MEVGDPLRQDDLDLRLLDQHVVVDVINKAHVEHVDVALVEDVLVAWHVVADHVMGFPATEERESWAQITLVAGAWTEREKMYHGGSFLKLADDNMDIQNPEAQNRELSGF